MSRLLMGCMMVRMVTRSLSAKKWGSMRPEHPRITVVNDSPEFLALMQDLLQDATYPSTLIDGDRDNALELIEASKPDLLVVDLRMKGRALHGMEILRQVRNRPSLRGIPVLVCTAAAWGIEQVDEELASFERTSIVLKPFTIATLYGTIDRLLDG
jgi:two-component system chemotaxis response regulator CheY